MLIPRYLYTHEFDEYHELLVNSGLGVRRSFGKGETLWEAGEYVERVYYFEKGVAKTYFLREDGRKKTVYLFGPGTLFPGFHKSQFKLELSLVTQTVTPVEAIEFPRGDLYRLAEEHPALFQEELEQFARFINLLIFESAHEEYSASLNRLCDVLYLLSQSGVGPTSRIGLSQRELADILAVERESVSRLLSQLRLERIIATHRGWLEVLDFDALLGHCSYEVMSDA